MGMEDAIKELYARREKMKQMGGKERVAKQHARGRLTARERIDKLLDPGSFWELGMHAHAVEPELAKVSPADGKICGIGTIGGRKVGIIAQDRTVLGGSSARIGGQKIATVHKMANEGGYPTIELADGGGARFPSTTGSAGLTGGSIGTHDSLTPTRKVPKIVAVMGEHFAAWEAARADFTVMVKGAAMGAAGPKMFEKAIGQKITPQELGGWEIQARETGQVDAVAENEEECFEIIKEFLSYMPSNNDEEPPYVPTQDDPCRRLENVGKIVPDQPNRGYDMHRLIKLIVDDGKFFPLKPEFGKPLITCLARIGGRVVGIYANNPFYNAGAPEIQAIEKVTDFLCLCDSFNIPLVSLFDIPGMFPGKDAERQKLPTKIVVWLQAQNLVTLPKILIIVRKSYAMGYLCMTGNLKRTDFMVAWPSATISFADPDALLDVAAESRIARAQDPEAEKERVLEEWAIDSAPWGGAGLYGLQDVIDPRDTRKFIAQALDIARGERGKIISEHRLQNWPTGF